MNTMKNLPEKERPYEKCFERGPEALTDCELLSVILRTGTNGVSAYELAGQILNLGNQKENLLSIMHLNREQLLEIKGIGMVKAVQILCIGELAKRISMKSKSTGVLLDKPYTIAEYYMEKMRHLEQEYLIIMFLDTKCRLIKDKTLSMGTINESLISAREIFLEALRCNASGVILVHNHPSGDCTPSRDDVESTKKIKKAGELIGILVLDHIIIGDHRYSSFKELKLM